MAPSRVELLHGTLELLILRTLLAGPCHGHAINRKPTRVACCPLNARGDYRRCANSPPPSRDCRASLLSVAIPSPAAYIFVFPVPCSPSGTGSMLSTIAP